VPATIPFLVGLLLGLALGAVLWRRPSGRSVRLADPADFAPFAWVLRSGHGWLDDPATLRMVGNRRDWTSPALYAHRYASPEAAAPDLARLRAAGMEAELVALNRRVRPAARPSDTPSGAPS
jgi:hypothetical protein